MLTVVETLPWQRSIASIWNEAQCHAFIDFIAQNPQAGDVMPSTSGLRKVRWSRSGMGKQGGVRVIYFTRIPQGQVVLLFAYTKAKFDNLPTAYLNSLKEQYHA